MPLRSLPNAPVPGIPAGKIVTIPHGPQAVRSPLRQTPFRTMPEGGLKESFAHEQECLHSCRFRARDRIRTCDLLMTNQLLYQLSYTGVEQSGPDRIIPLHKPQK